MGEATAEQSDRMCSSFSCLLCGNGSESAMKFIPNHLGVISCQKRWRQTGNRNATKCFLCKTYSANGVQLTNIQVRPAGQTFNACHISVTSYQLPKDVYIYYWTKCLYLLQLLHFVDWDTCYWDMTGKIFFLMDWIGWILSLLNSCNDIL